MPTRNYSQGDYGLNVYGEWAATVSGTVTISSASSLSLTAAVPTDTYGSGQYGYGNYSAGTIRDGSATVTGASTLAVSGSAIRQTTITVNAVSSVTCSAQGVRGGIIPAQATSSLSVAVNITFSGNPFPINGVATVTAVPNRILFIDPITINGAGTLTTSARLKWVDETIATTSWTEVYKVAA